MYTTLTSPEPVEKKHSPGRYGGTYYAMHPYCSPARASRCSSSPVDDEDDELSNHEGMSGPPFVPSSVLYRRSYLGQVQAGL